MSRNLDGTAEAKSEPSDPLRDTLQESLEGLERAGAELGAEALAVLVLETASVEVTYRRTVSGDAPKAGEPIRCCREVLDSLANGAALEAETPAASFLASAVAGGANSFLVFPWRTPKRTVVVVFGFPEREPKHLSVPAHIASNIHLAAVAAWSFQEVNRLRGELRAVNGRFAGRTLIERAKGKLQTERGLTEQEAYEYLRRMSRRRRLAMPKLAEELLRAPPGTES
jgi:hypothetical protein